MRGELDWIILKCLEKDRGRRYQAASGLARDLERYLADEPVEACPPTAGYTGCGSLPASIARRCWWRGGFVLLLLALGVIVAAWRGGAGDLGREGGPKVPSSRRTSSDHRRGAVKHEAEAAKTGGRPSSDGTSWRGSTKTCGAPITRKI